MQKIVPSLWFDSRCEEAMQLYTSVFPSSKIILIKKYPSGITDGPMAGFDGKVLTGIFELDGYRIMALDGGPIFKPTPASSFSYQCKDESEIDALYTKLREGGEDLMALAVYPWSKKYAWFNDRYGNSWQLNVPHDFSVVKHRFAPFRMFYGTNNGKAEEAMNHYISILGGTIDAIHRYEAGEPGTLGTINHAEYSLFGQQFMAMDSSAPHGFEVTGAQSYFVECETQDEIDTYWALSADPSAEQCGWIKDKYGFSWQIAPRVLGELMSNPDPSVVGRVTTAFMQMKKFDIAKLEAAAKG